ncbi:MAG: hypothetical protein JNL24_13495 [Bacteroidia bacterium]|nr:hypothetical protein [Bacteroidia bacterium]
MTRYLFLFAIPLSISCNTNHEGETASNGNITPKKDSLIFTNLYHELQDMEMLNDPRLTKDIFSSGQQSHKLSKDLEYSIGFNKLFQDIPSFQGIQKITIGVQSFSKQKIKDAVLVVSIDNAKEQKNIFWEGKPLVFDPINNWNKNNFNYEINPEFIAPGNSISVYVWNKTKEEFYIDDLVIDIFGNTKIANDVLVSNSNFLFDFETTEGIVGPENIKATTAHSGKQAIDMSDGKEYGPSIVKVIKEIATEPFKKVSASVWVYPTQEKPNLVLTASSINEQNGEAIFWEGKSTENSVFPINTWTKLNASFNVPVERLTSDNKIQINIWNKGKTGVIVDDLEIVYGTPNERKGLPSSLELNAQYEKGFTPIKNTPPFEFYFLNKKISSNSLAEYSSKDNIVSGNFIASSKTDELVCIKNKTARIYSLNTNKKEFEKIAESSANESSLFEPSNVYFSGDYNSDGKQDLLCINTTNGNWQTLNYLNNKWQIGITGKNSLKEHWYQQQAFISSGKTFTDKDALTLSNGKSLLSLQLINEEWQEKMINIPASAQTVFHANDVYYTGSIAGSKQTLLLNKDWRFDLKLISTENNDPTIRYMIDFKGYESDHNPKYYEFTKLVSGNFYSENNLSLLVFSSNCADSKFDGIMCSSIENNKQFPNKIELYTFEK